MREPPVRLFGHRPDRQVRPSDERGCDREAVAEVVGRPAPERRERAAVVVADVWRPAGVVGQQPGGEREPAGRVIEERLPRVGRDSRNGQSEEIKIEGIPVVVRRTLAVAAVGGDLTVDFGNEDAPAGFGPPAAAAQLRQSQAADVECERLAEQVSVRAEVIREMVLDLPEVGVDGDHQIDGPRVDVVDGRVGKEVQRPHP